MSETPFTPFYMWAGGKTKLVKHYESIWPEMSAFTSYVEPFFGGGAIFTWLRSQGFDRSSVIGDINYEIIGLLNVIASNPDTFIHSANLYIDEFFAVPSDKGSRKEWFYRKRQEYWDSQGENIPLLYILMRLAFNGIWQTCKASNGLFGTPAGLLNQKTPEQILDPVLIRRWASELQGASIQAVSYDSLAFNPEGALIYLDPPYRDSFTTYGTGFSDDDQRAVVEWALAQHKQGATVLLANRCVEDDDFFEALLPNAEFHYFDVTYTAGRRKRTEEGFEAKPAREFLAILK